MKHIVPYKIFESSNISLDLQKYVMSLPSGKDLLAILEGDQIFYNGNQIEVNITEHYVSNTNFIVKKELNKWILFQGTKIIQEDVSLDKILKQVWLKIIMAFNDHALPEFCQWLDSSNEIIGKGMNVHNLFIKYKEDIKGIKMFRLDEFSGTIWKSRFELLGIEIKTESQQSNLSIDEIGNKVAAYDLILVLDLLSGTLKDLFKKFNAQEELKKIEFDLIPTSIDHSFSVKPSEYVGNRLEIIGPIPKNKTGSEVIIEEVIKYTENNTLHELIIYILKNTSFDFSTFLISSLKDGKIMDYEELIKTMDNGDLDKISNLSGVSMERIQKISRASRILRRKNKSY